MISTEQQAFIQEVVRPYNPALVGIFGSYARNENTHSSDLDILVDIDADISLLDIIGMEQLLTEKLGIKVDLVTARSLHSSIRSYVYSDLIRIV